MRVGCTGPSTFREYRTPRSILPSRFDLVSVATYSAGLVAYVVMTYVVMACVIMACVVIAYVLMAYVAMAY